MSKPFGSYKRKKLVRIITDIAQFYVGNFDEGTITEPQCMDVSYVIACFLAQNTPMGGCGVEMEWPSMELQLTKRMSYAERKVLVEAIVEKLQ